MLENSHEIILESKINNAKDDVWRFLKPGSHLCDKHNTSDISTSISTRKKEHVPFFLVLMLMLMSLVLCLSHKCEPGFNAL